MRGMVSTSPGTSPPLEAAVGHGAAVTPSAPFTRLSRLVERRQSTDYGPTHADRPVGPRHDGALRVRRLHEGLAERHKHTAQLELGPGGKHERRLGERNDPTLGDGEVEYDE